MLCVLCAASECVWRGGARRWEQQSMMCRKKNLADCLGEKGGGGRERGGIVLNLRVLLVIRYSIVVCDGKKFRKHSREDAAWNVKLRSTTFKFIEK